MRRCAVPVEMSLRTGALRSERGAVTVRASFVIEFSHYWFDRFPLDGRHREARSTPSAGGDG
jgi:hypothetical protein